MKIKKIEIKNFRSIKGQAIQCSDQTVFIGANGVGKSTVLHALSAFFENTFKPKKEDYFAHNIKEPIEISVIFSNFTEEEKKEFDARIHNNEMAVTRIFGGENNENGDYQGMILGNPAFSEIRKVKTAKDKQAIYKSLIDKNGYELPSWSNQATAEESLSEWEKKNPKQCSLIRDGGSFFGARNVGAGKIQNAANFVLIEAVRDAAEDANDQKSSAVAQLMDIIVRSAMQQNEKIKKYQEEVNVTYHELTKPSNFPELGSLETALTSSLGAYYQGVGVKLDWKDTGGVNLPPPQAHISFKEDKFEYSVERAGNGIQRAFIISLLHQLLIVKSSKAQNESNNNNSETDLEQSQSALEKLPSIILAIEEPELYQHPTKQWHFAQVLKQLSSGSLKDTFGDVQVIFCTHAPNFIDLSEFDCIRMTSKKNCSESDIKETVISSTEIKQVSELLEDVWSINRGTFSDLSTKSRLHIFGTELSEGFFADGIILVEGITDKIAIQTVAKLIGVNLPEQNIAVLPVNGKNNIDRPCAVFKKIGIPVYMVWDSDKSKNESEETNKVLQKIAECSDGDIIDYPSGVFQSFSCFEENLNDQMKNDFGTHFQEAYTKACAELGFKGQDGAKNPYVISMTLKKLYKDGHSFVNMENLINKAVEYIKGQNEHNFKVAA